MLNNGGKRKHDADAGRVRVYVRVRPLSKDDLVGLKDRERDNGYEIKPDFNQIKLLQGKQFKEKYYRFDKVFPAAATNVDVFNAVGRPFVHAAVSGFNGTLFAYGQTGSGKTYSLMAQDGMVSCIVDRLFARISADKKHSYKITCAYMQIYQEKIYDLLNSNPKFDLFIREDPKSGIYVENLSHYVCHTPLDIYELLRIGRKRLVFAETRMNRQSSRSHSVCQITVEKTNAGSCKGTDNSLSFSRPASCSSPVSEIENGSSIPTSSQQVKGKSSRRKSTSPEYHFGSRPAGVPFSRRKCHSSGNLALNRKKSNIPVSFDAACPRRGRSVLITGTENGPKTPDIKNSDETFWSSRPSSPEELLQPGSTVSLASDVYSDTDSVLADYELNTLNMSTPDVSLTRVEFLLEENDDSFLDESDEIRDDFEHEPDIVLRGKINICDLAGSERIKKTQAEGDRLSEAQHINLSLLELGNVVAALAEGTRAHVPFRNSVLTRLLQDSLGGNCKTSFLLCVSPNMRDLNETKCTLDFGQRALKVSTAPRMNVEVDYKRLVEELQRKLEEKEAECKIHSEEFEKSMEALRNKYNLEMQEKLEEQKQVQMKEVQVLKRLSKNLEVKLNCEKERNTSMELMKARSILITELMSLQLLSQLIELKEQIVKNDSKFDNTGDLLGVLNRSLGEGQERTLLEEIGLPDKVITEDSPTSLSGYETESRPSQESSTDDLDPKLAKSVVSSTCMSPKRPLSVSSDSSWGYAMRPCSPLLEKLRSPYMSRKNSLLEEFLVENQFHLHQKGDGLLKSMTAKERIDALRKDVTRTKATITNELRSYIITHFQGMNTDGLEGASKKDLYNRFAHHLMDNDVHYTIEQLDQALNLVSVDHILTGCLLVLDEKRETNGSDANIVHTGLEPGEEKSPSLEELHDGVYLRRDEAPDGESKHSDLNGCPIAQVERDAEEEKTPFLPQAQSEKIKRKGNRFSRFLCMPVRSSMRQKKKK